MTINTEINGVVVPVEVTVEELRKHGFCPIDDDWNDYLRTEGNRILRDEIIFNLTARMDLGDLDGERLMDIPEWEEYRDSLYEIADDDFAEKVISGELLKEMTEKAKELLPKKKLYEVEVELVRTVVEKQIITITLEGECEQDVQNNIDDYLSVYDLEEYIGEYGWQRDDYSCNDDIDIDRTTICGEADEKENFVEL